MAFTRCFNTELTIEIKTKQMKKELTIDGKLYRLVEEKPELKVGDWYKGTLGYICLCLNAETGHNAGFDPSGEWEEDNGMLDSSEWQPANMEEVEKLLIGEAEKMGFKNAKLNNGSVCRFPLRLWDKCGDLVDEGGNIILDFKTGKWAEIIEDKKPLYTNSYGTEFFEGDNYWYVSKNNARIYGPLNDSTKDYAATAGYSEMFKNKEQCLEWIESKLKK